MERDYRMRRFLNRPDDCTRGESVSLRKSRAPLTVGDVPHGSPGAIDSHRRGQRQTVRMAAAETVQTMKSGALTAV
jgi:hypothetical protein